MPNSAISRFTEALPGYPLCADNFNNGLAKQHKSDATHQRYIQHNRTGRLHYLTFDIDNDYAYFAANDALLPPPTIATLNPDNGRGHLHYELNCPVTECADYPKPAQYARAIRISYTARLDADAGYTGLITKNPLSDFWRVYTNDAAVYSLTDLADWVALPKLSRRQDNDIEYLGRNCTLFNDCRHWAYRAIRHYYHDRRRWDVALLAWCHEYNAANNATDLLPDNEVRHVARSIAKWVWQKFNAGQFSQIQSHRGKLSAAAKRQATETRITAAIADLTQRGQRVTQAAVARMTGLSRAAINQHYKHFF